MKIYIAGPVTGVDGYEKKFEEAEAFLLEKAKNDACLEIFNPIKIVKMLQEGMDEEPSWVDYMECLIPFVVSSDALFLLKGWEKSKGARIERIIALSLGKEVFNEGEFMPDCIIG